MEASRTVRRAAGAPLRVPRATYRLQFHRGFTLKAATELIPYLFQLGISHVYASPLLTARSGSLHGYDVCNFQQLGPDIGTPDDLAQLVAALRAHEMGLVLDIVPNHMGIGGRENRWWWDVLERGPQSRFARHFDIDWESPDPRLRGKVLVPVLAEPYESILERRELSIAREDGFPVICYFEHRFPVATGSLPDEFNRPDADLAELNANPGALDAILRQQHYRLAHWRLGDVDLNYRRFFNVTTLAGLRVEDAHVFDDTHSSILDWCRRGFLDGLRVDHPDGLRDPGEYFERLSAATPETWIVVEKILEPGESLPAGWPVAGTTGYDFANRVNSLFVDPAGEEPLTRFYAEFTGEPVDFAAIVREKKRFVLRYLLAAEVHMLTEILVQIAARQWRIRDCAREKLRDAVIELAACFPVYRTYVRPDDRGASYCDAARIAEAVGAARPQLGLAPEQLAFLEQLLQGRVRGTAEDEFMMRFQQLTGPAMAKGVEDTTFYCFNRFVALNEVGGDPGRFAVCLDGFHDACLQAQRDWPNALLATSTHDTKRSEDVRARLCLLSEIPAAWTGTVRRWSAANESRRTNDLPDRNAEYLFYQILVGAWPLSKERALAYMEKATREAKQYTTWTDANPAYEKALKDFIAGALADPAFTGDVTRFVETLQPANYVNSLAQTLLKLTSPGIPDVYQGTELWDLSLVDPDNRRPVDFALRGRLLNELEHLTAEQVWERRQEGLPKIWMIRKTLSVRRAFPEWFAGDYSPVIATGAEARHVVAAIRGGGLTVVVPRLTMGLHGEWSDTALTFPAGEWQNEYTGETIPGGPHPVARLLARFPVALFRRIEGRGG